MAWTYALATTTPAGSDAMSTVDDVIVAFKGVVCERLTTTEYGFAVGETDNTLVGTKHHRYMVQASAPGATASCVKVYSKDVSAKAELFVQDEDGNEVQVTNGGVLKSTMQSKARAYLGSNQTVSASTWTKVLLDTESYDVLSEFASNKFIVTTTGYYHIVGKLAGSTSTVLGIAIYKNGALSTYVSFTVASGVPYPGIVISDILYLSATDYIELYGYVAGSTIIYGGSTLTHMSIHRLS